MRTIERSNQFRKDYKNALRGRHEAQLNERLRTALECLASGESLPDRFHDHQLNANWRGFRDCHLFPDLVLIYRVVDNEVVQLVRLGSHSQLSL